MNSSVAILITALAGAVSDCPKPKTPVKYDKVHCPNQDIAMVKQGKHYGVVNLQGELIIPVEYEDFRLIKNGNIIAKKNGKFGIIDRQHTIIEPVVYDSISVGVGANDDFAVMIKDGKSGISNIRTGDVVLPYDYESVYPHPYQKIIYLKQKQNGQTKVGFADYATGQILLKPTYDDYAWVSEKLFVIVKLNGKYGVINHDMQTILPIKFDRVFWVKGDKFYTSVDGKVAYFDEHGQEIKQ